MTFDTLNNIWEERQLLAPAFACAMGVGYLPLLVLPWTFGALVTGGGYSESQAGWIATAEIGALAIASLFAARWATVRGRRFLAGLSMLLAALANGVTVMTPPTGATFIVARIVSGAACGVAVAVGNAAAAGSKNPTRAFAVLWFLMALWQFAIFNATPAVIGRAGLAGAYGLIALACLCFLPLGLRVPDPAPDLSQRSQATVAGFRNLQSIAILAAFLCFWLRDSLVYSMSQRLALDAGVSAQPFGTILGIASVVGLLGPMLAARQGSGAPHGRVIGASLLLALGVSTVMAIGRSELLFSAAVLLMPAVGLFAAAILSGLAAHVDTSGRLVALGAGLGFLSEAIGPALGGSVIQFGGRAVYAALVIAVGALTLLAAFAAKARVRDTRCAATSVDTRSAT